MTVKFARWLVATLTMGSLSVASAASFSLSPSSQVVSLEDGSVTIGLHMDFDVFSIGGGLMIEINGPIGFASFTPSGYFNSLDTIQMVSQCPGYDAGNPGTFCNPDFYDFTGYGTDMKPDSADWEIHFGSFGGVTGSHQIGTLSFALLGTGLATIDLQSSPGAYFGPFVNLMGMPIDLELNGATLEISAIPVPASFWLLGSAMGVLGSARRLRRRAVA